jgi:GxxExxY protein
MPVDLNSITGAVVDSAMKVHSALGPGLLESAYKACLAYELLDRGLPVESEVPLPVVYRGIKLNAAYRIDFIVADSVIVEVKAVEKILSVHHAQLLAYLRLSGKTLGLLLNFNVTRLKYGITRLAN